MSETVVDGRDVSAVNRAAARLQDATRSGVPVAPVRDLIGRYDIEAAYAVQSAMTLDRLAAGAVIVGRKVGLTSEAVQRQVGVDQPDFGVLFDDMAYGDGATISWRSILQPRVEAEIAFVLKEDLVDGDLDVDRVRGAIDYAVAALEICGSRIAGWDISVADTVADNASAGAFVLGAQRRTLDEFSPGDVEMHMSLTSAEDSTGSGAACLGDPLNAVVWLARQALAFGSPLVAGQVILSGALGPMRPVVAGDIVNATVTGLGSVSVRFSH
ncbi:MAG: 2-keto-4-pentenoate hydratase [Nocardioides sp.]|uniref:2-keto-4-pentenoate hydratase n=1 Tax=Nocardioides sp. TaxID=35761 RepID=UPI0039E5EC40